MTDSYVCCSCKLTHRGDPHYRNGAGVFCQKCRARMLENIVAGTRALREARRGICPWCGADTSGKTNVTNGNADNVCKVCDANQSWLLKCIRFSGYASKYVSRTESREAPSRQARLATAEEARKSDVRAEFAADPRNPDFVKLGRAIHRIAEEFGIKLDDE